MGLDGTKQKMKPDLVRTLDGNREMQGSDLADLHCWLHEEVVRREDCRSYPLVVKGLSLFTCVVVPASSDSRP